MTEEGVLFLIALVGVASWLFFKLRGARKHAIRLQAEKDELVKAKVALEAENALLETEHLKFQMQPHTLNNILANLKMIATKLSRGIDALSSTLDYILYKGKTHLVSVEDELDFIETYLKLNDLFLTEVDAITVDTSEVDRDSGHFKEACIPHLISAYFVENAFKHGDKDHPEFLRIRVRLDAKLFQLQVSNRIKEKTSERTGGLGLSNMRKRLELLMLGRYTINTSTTAGEYHAMLTIQLEP